MANIAKVGFKHLLGNRSLKHLTGRDSLLLRTIISKAAIPEDQRQTKPKPWPYHKKRFNWLTSLYDKTSKRFDENTKVNMFYCLM